MQGPSDGYVALMCHWPRDEPFWLEDALEGRGFRVKRFSTEWGRRRHTRSRLTAYVGALRLTCRAAWYADRHGGVVVTQVSNLSGVFASVLPPARGLRRRPVLCPNLILFDRAGAKGHVRNLLYRVALRNPRTVFTVSSARLQRRYARMLHVCPERFLVLPDCYSPRYRSFAQHDPLHDGGYVFAGGDAARDWATTIAVAQACSDIPFLLVARKRQWPRLALPANVHVEFDIPVNDFWEKVRSARLVLLLLTNDIVTAGLIVVTHAALIGSPVIATRTAATEGYFPPDAAEFLVPMRDPAEAIDLVRRYWNDPEARQSAAERLQRHVVLRFSPEDYADTIAAVIRRI